jgi:hypothetical protein
MDTKETLLSNLLPGARLAIAYAEKLLVGIPEELAARKPVVAGTLIETNHPVFIFGHLSLYPSLLAELIGLPRNDIQTPEHYPALFQIGSPCLDDTKGEIYPKLSEVAEQFLKNTRTILDILPQLDMLALSKELENPSRKERFGTVGAFALYILLAHPQAHLGQISVWRRCMGLSAA